MSINFLGDHDCDWTPQQALASQDAYVLFSGNREVAIGDNGPVHLGSHPDATVLIGTVGNLNLYVGQSDLALSWEPLRPSIRRHTDDVSFIAMSAGIQRLEFLLEHRFCGRCGSKTQSNPGDSGVRCSNPGCALVSYPRIAPSVIVLVIRGDQCLLARSPRFEPGMYSTLAGFLEAGESAEHAIRREIREEVGIEVKNPRYFATQSWPFKHSLMMGYFAEYESGKIQVDGVEIVDAQWYSAEDLPQLPLSASISRALIDTWLASRNT